MKNPIYLLLFLLIFSGALLADTTRVLFIGNSYTYVNDLPAIFRQLSVSGNKLVRTEISAYGGYSLSQHINDAGTTGKIKAGIWNYVVLQEQSQMPVIEYYRYFSTYPSSISLDSLIKSYGMNTAFFMTWGRRDGGQQCIDSCSPVFRDFFHMQDSLKSSYKKISDSLHSLLVPVGEAWRLAKILKPYSNLFDADGSHPSPEGSYLAACVFYAKIFGQSPVGLSYTGGLQDTSALFYQQCAWQTVSGIAIHTDVIPDKYILLQNYPNPFNPITKIKFQIPHNANAETQEINLKIYDALGREIQTLINENLQPGTYEVNFDGANLNSGIFFYRLNYPGNYLSRKMILIK